MLHADYARLEFVRLLRYDPDTRIDTPGGLVGSRLGDPEVSADDLVGAPAN